MSAVSDEPPSSVTVYVPVISRVSSRSFSMVTKPTPEPVPERSTSYSVSVLS